MVNMVKELHPDIAFVDIKMPKLSGVGSNGKINTSCPQTQCVISQAIQSLKMQRKQ